MGNRASSLIDEGVTDRSVFNDLPVYSVSEAWAQAKKGGWEAGTKVQIVGRAVHKGKMLKTPITETPCLAASFHAQYAHRRLGTDANPNNMANAVQTAEEKGVQTNIHDVVIVDQGVAFDLTDGERLIGVSLPSNVDQLKLMLTTCHQTYNLRWDGQRNCVVEGAEWTYPPLGDGKFGAFGPRERTVAGDMKPHVAKFWNKHQKPRGGGASSITAEQLSERDARQCFVHDFKVSEKVLKAGELVAIIGEPRAAADGSGLEIHAGTGKPAVLLISNNKVASASLSGKDALIPEPKAGPAASVERM